MLEEVVVVVVELEVVLMDVEEGVGSGAKLVVLEALLLELLPSSSEERWRART